MTLLDERNDMPTRFMRFRFYGSAYARPAAFQILVRALIPGGGEMPFARFSRDAAVLIFSMKNPMSERVLSRPVLLDFRSRKEAFSVP